MALKQGGGVFFKLPVRDAAMGADIHEPFVSEPSGCSGVQGVAGEKHPVAMGGQAGGVTQDLDGSDAVKLPCPGGPQLDLADEIEQPDPFSIESFLDAFCLFFFRHWPPHGVDFRRTGKEFG